MKACEVYKKMTEFEVKINEILLDIGVPMHLDGYRYLMRAATLYAEHGSRPLRMMTDIYAVVAKEAGTTASCVEHSIRTAIDKAFREGDIDTLDRLFGRTISSATGKVTGHAFLAAIVYHASREVKVG